MTTIVANASYLPWVDFYALSCFCAIFGIWCLKKGCAASRAPGLVVRFRCLFPRIFHGHLSVLYLRGNRTCHDRYSGRPPAAGNLPEHSEKGALLCVFPAGSCSALLSCLENPPEHTAHLDGRRLQRTGRGRRLFRYLPLRGSCQYLPAGFPVFLEPGIPSNLWYTGIIPL